jgi:HD-GYP domain-containing protein (c-di-GMP phosphodiesterase class II)
MLAVGSGNWGESVSDLKQVKVDIADLIIGMYVSGLDKPWSQTPFPIQGFYIRQADEIEQLRMYCKYVFIDVQRGKRPIAVRHAILEKKNSDGSSKFLEKRQRQQISAAPLKLRHNFYGEPISLRKENVMAEKLHTDMKANVGQLMKGIRSGAPIEMKTTSLIASQVVDSVVRNPDAFFWLSRIKDKDEFTYGHIVRSAIWAGVFGRHIGLDKKDMNMLVSGVLLKDVGKVKLPELLLQVDESERTQEQEREFRKYVEHSAEILKNTPGVPAEILHVVKNHCERFDGSGYPQGLMGDKIPFLAKVAGIVSVYDAVTNPRSSKYPLAPSKAMAKLYDMRNVEFQEELVVQFIQALGIYPTGTLVELNTGEVAVVVEQTFARRLKPKVAVVMDKNKKRLDQPQVLDLFEDFSDKLRKAEKQGQPTSSIKPVEIVKDLEPGSFDVDVATVRDNYLKESWNWKSLLGGIAKR